MQFTIHNRWTGEAQFTADIDCSADALHSVKVGLAVKWGRKNGANLTDANLRGANLTGANLTDANLGGASLTDANLRGANLGHANLGGASLTGANLRDANLTDANLGHVNLGGASLTGASLTDANLGGANLRGANLRGANLGDANLGGASLTDANLRDANLGGASLGGHKIKRLIARATRVSDDYEAQVYETETGEIVGKWGCRVMTLADFTARAEGYACPDQRAETLNIIAFVRAEAERLGVGATEAA